jgi:hypothetical protein
MTDVSTTVQKELDQITAAIAILGKAVEELHCRNEDELANYAKLANQVYRFLEHHDRG